MCLFGMFGEEPVNLALQLVRGKLTTPLSPLIILLRVSDKEGLERGLLAWKIKVVFSAFILVFKSLQRFLGGAVIVNHIRNSPTPLCVEPLDAVP